MNDRPTSPPAGQKTARKQPPPPTEAVSQPKPSASTNNTPLPPVTATPTARASDPVPPIAGANRPKSIERQASRIQPQPPVVHNQPPPEPTPPSNVIVSESSKPTGSSTGSSNVKPSGAANQVDPLEYNAMMETNQALKSELQRLSVIELKYKQLEKEVSFYFI